ncbi:DUF1566 domain-containing protein [bacterium]|nr:DUF1566 domain-containing protein [bacterium]
MKKVQKPILIVAIITVSAAIVLLLPRLIGAGALEPTAPPGPTMNTLDEIPPTWSQILPASERFVLVMGGEAVLDKETGLTWAKDANLTNGIITWQNAIDYCANLSLGGRKGWRLPTREELASLIDSSQSNPALPIVHPFINVDFGGYWSSTDYEGNSANAWSVYMHDGHVPPSDKNGSLYVWPVRGGN